MGFAGLLGHYAARADFFLLMGLSEDTGCFTFPPLDSISCLPMQSTRSLAGSRNDLRKMASCRLPNHLSFAGIRHHRHHSIPDGSQNVDDQAVSESADHQSSLLLPEPLFVDVSGDLLASSGALAGTRSRRSPAVHGGVGARSQA